MCTVDLCFIWAVRVERKRCSAASVDIGQLIEIEISRVSERESTCEGSMGDIHRYCDL